MKTLKTLTYVMPDKYTLIDGLKSHLIVHTYYLAKCFFKENIYFGDTQLDR